MCIMCAFTPPHSHAATPRARRTAPGEFTITFCCLDPGAPSRSCAFTLLTDAGPGGAYALSACEPPLQAAPQLLAALNAAPHKGLARFVAGMRAAFRRECTPAALCDAPAVVRA